MSTVSQFDFFEEPNNGSFKIVTRFNEDEVLSIEIIEDQFCTAVANYYAAQGYGVCVEDQQ